MLAVHKRKRRFRDPERTRERLLHAAFREVHRSGFQSAGIDTILAATNVTKGALYHHFDSKEALGYAIVEEIVAKLVRDRWLRPLLQRRATHRHFDRHCPGVTSATRRRSSRLSAAQFGTGDVSTGRAIPQAAGEHIPCLAGRRCYAFAERAGPTNCSHAT